jgi:hypothetical protein
MPRITEPFSGATCVREARHATARRVPGITAAGGPSQAVRRPFSGAIRRGWPARHWRKFRFALPDRAQIALLQMPALQYHMEAKQRAMFVEAANRLIGSGCSHNRSAAILGVAAVTLWTWRQAFAKGGYEALIPRRRFVGRKPSGPEMAATCAIDFFITK